MGIYASHFHKNDDQILTTATDPSQANWIAIHAKTCKMTVPEVQRCWSWFLILQPDQKGNLPRMRLLQTNNPFGQKLLKQIPVTGDDQITFQTYCNAVSWLSKSSLETKLKDANPMDLIGTYFQCLAARSIGTIKHCHSLYKKAVLANLLILVYLLRKPVPDMLFQIVGEDCSSMFFYVPLRDGSIGQCWFKSNPSTIQPGLYQTLSSGNIGKEELRDLLHDLYPMQSHSAIDELSAVFLKEVDKNNQGYISEDMFVAWVLSFPEEIVKSALDFPVIPPNLTLSEPPTSYLSILKMLQSWRSTCQEAPLPILQAALRESGNEDICNEVFHLSF